MLLFFSVKNRSQGAKVLYQWIQVSSELHRMVEPTSHSWTMSHGSSLPYFTEYSIWIITWTFIWQSLKGESDNSSHNNSSHDSFYLETSYCRVKVRFRVRVTDWVKVRVRVNFKVWSDISAIIVKIFRTIARTETSQWIFSLRNPEIWAKNFQRP